MISAHLHASSASAAAAAAGLSRLCSSGSSRHVSLWRHAAAAAAPQPQLYLSTQGWLASTAAAAAGARDGSSSAGRSYSSSSSSSRGGGSSSRGRGGGRAGRDSSNSRYDRDGDSSSRDFSRGSSSSRGGRGAGGGGGRGQRGGGRSWGTQDRRQQQQESQLEPQPQQQQWRQQPQQQPQKQRYRQEEAGGDYSWRGGGGDDDQYYGSSSGGGDDEDYDDGFLYPSRPSKASIMDTLDGDALYGVAPVLAALTAGIRRPYALIMQEGLNSSSAARKDGRALGEIQRLAVAAGAEMRTMSKHDLNMLSGNRPHQGLILDASGLVWRELDQLPDAAGMQQQPSQQEEEEGEEETESSSSGSRSRSSSSSRLQHPVWLALDEVMDPQNLGAMLRSAYCLGVSGVLACSRNCAPLSPVVSKASAGAMELMTLHSCKSMPRTLSAAVNSGWAVIGAAAEEGAVPLSELKVDGPTVLVMGNEGYGVRPLVKRLCTQLVQIEMSDGDVSAASRAAVSHRLKLVDSLNVSVATGILLHHMLASAKQ